MLGLCQCWSVLLSVEGIWFSWNGSPYKVSWKYMIGSFGKPGSLIYALIAPLRRSEDTAIIFLHLKRGYPFLRYILTLKIQTTYTGENIHQW